VSAAAPPVATGLFADVRPGIRLHYASAGDPGLPLLLCLHGFPEFWRAWAQVMPRLAERFHVVAPDLRGFNLSSKPAEVAAYRAQELVGDIDGLVDALGYDRFHLAGHDWGGALAWTVAIQRPRRVRRLVILNAPHPVPFARMLAADPAQQAASRYMNWLRRPGSEARLAEDDFARLDGFFAEPGGCGWFDGDTREAYHRAWSQPGALTGGVNYYRASPLHPPTDAEPGAARLALDPKDFAVEAPTLVIWGERDRALLPGLLEGLEVLAPALRIERLPEASHWLMHEQPERVAELISGFLD
jgi:epoxide hydrolase 4